MEERESARSGRAKYVNGEGKSGDCPRGCGCAGLGGAGLKMGRKTTELERRSRTGTTGFEQDAARYRYTTSDVRHSSNGQSWPRNPKRQKIGAKVGTGAGTSAIEV